MSSKKAKKRRVKCKKKLKCGKVHYINQRKKINTTFTYNSRSDSDSNEKNVAENRYLYDKSCRFDPHRKGVFDLIDFAKMRDYYFDYLRNVVSQNCKFCKNKPSTATLENLSLELEKEALLASLQANTYAKTITKIINEIEKCTEEKQIYKEVLSLLPKENNEKLMLNTSMKNNCSGTSPNLQTQNFIQQSQELEKSLNNQLNIMNECCSAPNGHSLECPNTFPQQNGVKSTDSCNGENSLCDEDTVQTILKNSTGSVFLELNPLNQFPSSVETQTLNNSIETLECKNMISAPSINNFEKENPLLQSLGKLQESVESTLNASEKIFKQKAEEKERAQIAQILEGEVSLNEHSDSLSENESDTKKIIYEDSFMSRIEKMREIFGFEESYCDVKKKINDSTEKSTRNQTNCKYRKPTMWKHERVIQQYKFAMISSEMSLMRQVINKKLFQQLFGDDSDDECEAQYRSKERYRISCTERISSWVVKHLMPYYNEQRIIGRNVFKNLGHYISDAIVDKIQYPDEWTVKYFISKFFPTQKKYVSEADILAV